MSPAGRCPCGRNSFAVDGASRAALTRCTCPLCARCGHLYAHCAPARFTATHADSDAVYRWNSRTVASPFRPACGCDLYADSPAFQPDGTRDGTTWRIAVNARLLDDFEAADGAGWEAFVVRGQIWHLASRRHFRRPDSIGDRPKAAIVKAT